jgi:hypothetical protein
MSLSFPLRFLRDQHPIMALSQAFANGLLLQADKKPVIAGLALACSGHSHL